MPQSMSFSFTRALIVLRPSVTAASSGQPSANALYSAAVRNGILHRHHGWDAGLDQIGRQVHK